MGEATEYYTDNYLPDDNNEMKRLVQKINMLSEIEINQWLERIEKSIQSHNISFLELQNLITEKRTLLKVLGKEID